VSLEEATRQETSEERGGGAPSPTRQGTEEVIGGMLDSSTQTRHRRLRSRGRSQDKADPPPLDGSETGLRRQMAKDRAASPSSYVAVVAAPAPALVTRTLVEKPDPRAWFITKHELGRF
jgi:hypothetical protein